MAKRFGRKTDDDWKNMEVRRDVVGKNFRKRKGRVMFPSSHDITEDSKIKKACFTVLGKLLESGNEVLVTTKPRFSVTKDIIGLFSDYAEQIQFRFTITSRDNRLLHFWEPNAPSLEERLQSLAFSSNSNFKTSVSIEPFLDYNPRPLVETVSSHVTESIWLGIMNYIPRNHIPPGHLTFYDSIRQNYTASHIDEVYHDLRDFPNIRFKDTIWSKLASAKTDPAS